MLAVFIAFLVIIRWWRKDRELYQTNWKVKYTDLVFEDGTFNKVAKLNNKLVAVRPVNRKSVCEDKLLLADMKTLKAMSHTNLSSFVGACCDPRNVCAIWEYCSKGSLEELLLDPDTTMDPVKQISIALDIANGLLYLHASAIGVHGNFKLSSIVLDSQWVGKITDFGLTSILRNENKKESNTVIKLIDGFGRRLFWKKQKYKFRKKRTKLKEEETKSEEMINDDDYTELFWMSPERLRRRLSGEKGPVTKESDIYSLGVVLSQIIGQQRLYGGLLKSMTPKEIVTTIAHPSSGSKLTRPHIPEDVGRQSVAMATFKHLIESCWSEAVDKRPSIKRIVKKLKRIDVTRDKNLLDAMSDVKKRYFRKLVSLVAKSDTPDSDSVYASIPGAMKREVCQILDVTACFWSIMNFTTFAIQRSPAEALQVIQDIDSLAENVVKYFKIYQVETVCDSSLIIKGLDPSSNTDHAPIMADASLVLMDYMYNLQILPGSHNHNSLSIRIGLNSGSVMVGTVGKVNPRVCMFGKTVVSALQCEKYSSSQRIHISTSTYRHLQASGMYSMELRDPLDVKSVDDEPTYWLNGRLQEDVQESQL